MELEPLFTNSKWDIIKEITSKNQSPLQLAGKLNTTIANISQQLRLLEAANIVSKKKISNRDKGKPRTIFSIPDDFVYMISSMDSSAKKQMLKLTDYHKIVLKIWLIDNPLLHKYVEQIYWKIEPFFSEVEGIVVHTNSHTNLFLVCKKTGDIEKSIAPLIKEIESNTDRLKVEVLSKSQFLKKAEASSLPKEDVFAIYDPNQILLTDTFKETSEKTEVPE